MTIYRCQRHDRPIKLTQELGQGGEAIVWRTDFKGYVAKIYDNPHNERIEKLWLMVMQAPNDPNAHLNHISFTWPYSILENEAGEIVGYLMPEVMGSETLLKLCTPQLRRKLKLETNWYFLHVVARNVAGIIQAIHAKGYVLGDIKLENILVNNRALPTIIDTDSFQVPDPYNNRLYRCLVASEGFTPAELMGVDIASVDQTEVHDRFRLGVVIYYLLFGGPPFRGIWQGSGDSPEQSELIKRGLWPFSPDSLILASQTTMPLEILHPELKSCFLRCFNDGHQFPHKRPTAGDWVKALEVSLNEVVSCDKVDSHHYSLSYGHCYWCDRAKNFGLDIFPGNPVAKPAIVSQPIPTAPPVPLIVPPKTKKIPLQKTVAPNPLVFSRRKALLLGSFGILGIGTALNWLAQKNQLSLTNPVNSPSPSPTPQPVVSPSPKPSPSPSSTPKPSPKNYTEILPGGIPLEMIAIPSGRFLMGSLKSDPDAQKDEFLQHEVTVPSFAIGKYPVTQAQWQAVMGNNPSLFRDNLQNPVERVSWDDCQEFCEKLRSLTGKNYRLPSEAEWEYACRAGSQTRFSFGDDAAQLGDYAWYIQNSGQETHSVGQKKPNPWGLYDMHGNVWEWCEDGWHDDYQGAPADGSAWNDNHSQTSCRVLRGGSWSSNSSIAVAEAIRT